MNPEDVGFLHDQILDAVERDRLARILAEKNRVAGLEVRAAIGVPSARNRPGPAATTVPCHRLLAGGVRNEDHPGALRASLEALNDDVIVKGSYSHWGTRELMRVLWRCWSSARSGPQDDEAGACSAALDGEQGQLP